MSISQLHMQEFKNFFTGSQYNYGELDLTKAKTNDKKGGKVEGSYRMVTDKLITLECYKRHLNGEKCLGIVPLRENETCSFSVIDVDVYDSDLTIYIQAVERSGFPIVPFCSKSGGLHLYTFFKDPVPAKRAVELMRKFSFLLSIDLLVKNKGKGRVEIFPKQVKKEASENGSYINIPYFNAEETRSYAIRNGNSLTLNDAIIHIKNKLVSYDDAVDMLNNAEFSDAPPCLQLLYYLNPFSENSNRNNYLFSFGVYLKKKDEDYFDQNLLDLNRSIREPLDEKEVEDTLIKSLRRKDYSYKCKENPCVDFCNKKECRNREYGIGKSEGYFSSIELGQLYQYKMHQPYYEWDVRKQGDENYRRLRFKNEEEIIKQDAFMKLCMRELHELPNKLKNTAWFQKVNNALAEMKIVDVDAEYDTSPFMMMKTLIVEFLRGRVMAESREQIVMGRVYFDEEFHEYQFRSRDLAGFLLQKRFFYYETKELHGVLREMGAGAKRINYKVAGGEGRKKISVQVIPLTVVDEMEETIEIVPNFSDSKEDF